MRRSALGILKVVVMAPLVASFALLGVPGPCTTFDGVDAAILDGAPSDAPADVPDCGLALDFREGSVPGTFCFDKASTLCCDHIEKCAADDGTRGCSGYIKCVDECNKGRAKAECYAACTVPEASASKALLEGLGACFYHGSFDAAGCLFLPSGTIPP